MSNTTIQSSSSKSAEQLVNEVFARAPKGPIAGPKENIGPTTITAWSLIEDDGKYILYLPSNLETLADHPMAQIAVVAAKRLKTTYVMGTSSYDTPAPTDQKVLNYLHGVSWALNEDRGALISCPQVTGSMGHGFFYVAHQALDKQLGCGTSWAKGNPHSLTKGVSGVAWDKDLDASTRKIFSLVTLAAKSLTVTMSWASYFRPKDSFLGRELKKSLPHERLGLITRDESNYLASAYEKEIRAYKDMLLILRDPQLENLKSLGDQFKEIGKNLMPLCTLVDTLVTRRASIIYSRNKGLKKKQLKIPLTELIANMELMPKIKAFDPVQLHGLQSINVPEDMDLDNPDHISTLSAQYLMRLKGLSSSGLPTSLAALCQQWCAATLGSPRRLSNTTE